MSGDSIPPFLQDMFNLGNDEVEVWSQDVTGDGSTLNCVFRPSAEEKYFLLALGTKNQDDANTPDAVAYIYDGTDYVPLCDPVTLNSGTDPIYAQRLYTLGYPMVITYDNYLVVRVGGATKVANTKIRNINAYVVKVRDE